MAKESSIKQMERLARNYDSITIHTVKGVQPLMRLRALHEGIPISKLLQRAIVARCGLRMLPYPQQLEGAKDCKTQQQASVMIRRLQLKEQSDAICAQLVAKLSAEPDEKRFTVILDDADKAATLSVLQALVDEVSQPAQEEGTTVTITGNQLAVLRRLLSYIEPCLLQNE